MKPSAAMAVVAIATILAVAFGCASPSPEGARTVILVHGLGRTPASMTILATRLRDAGFRVVNFGYPSTSEEMEALVDRLESEVVRCCAGEAETVHFVTHSMGGILVWSYLDQQPEAHQGRVVMLSPPSRGSEVVDAFADSPMLRSVLGPAGSQLGTDSTAIPLLTNKAWISRVLALSTPSISPILTGIADQPSYACDGWPASSLRRQEQGLRTRRLGHVVPAIAEAIA